jgi:formylglycine-generating enzyme required for sulfatase activity
MRPLLAVFGLFMLALLGVESGEKKFPDPSPRKDAILKLFAEEFVLLTPGQGQYPASYVMGSAKDGAAAERPAHRVTFSYPFAMARYEVTQELYQVVMGDNPSKWKGPRNSVEMIDWRQASQFCDNVTGELRQRKLIAAEERICLPSEAEWEYACRAGTSSLYSFGDDVGKLTEHAWYKDNSKGYDPPVGKKQANPWGLFDMHGYVYEWCLDGWHPNYEGAPADGSAGRSSDDPERVFRGGAWSDSADAARSAARGHRPAETRSDAIGFRCVKVKVPRER